jgi:hypothetical protein
VYFDELLERIRDIRSSEKAFWRKVLDIYATSADYDPRAEASQLFFATVQNKMHWAAHGQTAAEVIAARADAAKPNMGLMTWPGSRPRKTDVAVAKNYLVPCGFEWVVESDRIVWGPAFAGTIRVNVRHSGVFLAGIQTTRVG